LNKNLVLKIKNPMLEALKIHGLPQKEKNENNTPMLMKSTQANGIFHEATCMVKVWPFGGIP